nr:MAG TPA: hypothetical protein [Caudoviricetes sp.]DAI50303.1 MAG TPA: hypothetical protein [Caudoviricetes sp.]
MRVSFLFLGAVPVRMNRHGSFSIYLTNILSYILNCQSRQKIPRTPNFQKKPRKHDF